MNDRERLRTIARIIAEIASDSDNGTLDQKTLGTRLGEVYQLAAKIDTVRPVVNKEN